MTLPPEKLGDKGQRYLIELEGYPAPGWQEVAYSDTEEGADRLMRSLKQAPGCTGYRITDREGLDDE